MHACMALEYQPVTAMNICQALLGSQLVSYADIGWNFASFAIYITFLLGLLLGVGVEMLPVLAVFVSCWLHSRQAAYCPSAQCAGFCRSRALCTHSLSR